MLANWSKAATLRVVKVGLFLAALIPLFILIQRIVVGDLGPDPGQAITEGLGKAAFQLLLATLFVTPLRKLTGWAGWIRCRRMLGLFAFFYAVLHVMAFLQLILGWGDLWATFTRRPYIIMGAAGFILLVPLALTSTQKMMKRMGRGWKPLHRLIYPSSIFVWLHFLWQARSDVLEMVIYGVVLMLLLLVRVYWFGVSSLVPLKKA
ncbi:MULTISPECIES: sulfite oxidase heme-binding subunit YedZ [unclassified Marinobacter]|uniref:sulfite oxidase heme-binding subunit YedZ n=1 Tax=unclassified Marinobacter TaxID=83889 RepID=UPI00273AD850|nr:MULTISPECIES: protein-methionine-sulfoxide reductase heme-binding subunit MsrQ [unclassified Marinobacter]MDP4548993.1 protein-methionine-sulfoxide reductase heme-binding subunit MsrQ [Marinobacter sp. MDS2]